MVNCMVLINYRISACGQLQANNYNYGIVFPASYYTTWPSVCGPVNTQSMWILSIIVMQVSVDIYWNAM